MKPSTIALLFAALLAASPSRADPDGTLYLYALILGAKDRCNLKLDTDKAIYWLRREGVDLYSDATPLRLSLMASAEHERVAAMDDQTLDWHCKTTRRGAAAFGISR